MRAKGLVFLQNIHAAKEGSLSLSIHKELLLINRTQHRQTVVQKSRTEGKKARRGTSNVLDQHLP